jgi:hypothetical protein
MALFVLVAAMLKELFVVVKFLPAEPTLGMPFKAVDERDLVASCIVFREHRGTEQLMFVSKHLFVLAANIATHIITKTSKAYQSTLPCASLTCLDSAFHPVLTCTHLSLPSTPNGQLNLSS